MPLLHCTERCSKKHPTVVLWFAKGFLSLFFLSSAITVGLWHVVMVYQPTAQERGSFCCWLQPSPLLSIAPRASLGSGVSITGIHTG